MGWTGARASKALLSSKLWPIQGSIWSTTTITVRQQLHRQPSIVMLERRGSLVHRLCRHLQMPKVEQLQWDKEQEGVTERKEIEDRSVNRNLRSLTQQLKQTRSCVKKTKQTRKLLQTRPISDLKELSMDSLTIIHHLENHREITCAPQTLRSKKKRISRV